MKHCVVLACFFISAWFASGCETPPPSGPSAEELSKPMRRWQRIIHVSDQGAPRTGTHVGFLCHEYTLADPGGKYHVYDVDERAIGFVLPSGKAFEFFENEEGKQDAREVAHFELDVAVARLFGLDGRVEFQDVVE